MNKTTLLTIAASTALLSTGLAHALTSPFVPQSLQQGYMVAEANTKAADSKVAQAQIKLPRASVVQK